MKTPHTRCKNLIFPFKSSKITRTTEVTALPPSFDWKLQIVLGSLLL
jgi:hypothetical protein